MQFNFWPTGSRFYLNGLGVKTSVGVSRGGKSLNVTSEDHAIRQKLLDLLTGEIKGDFSVEALERLLLSLSDSSVKRTLGLSPARPRGGNVIDFPQQFGGRHVLFDQAEDLEPRTIKFSSKQILNDIQIFVDHREPDSLVGILRESRIPSGNIVTCSQPMDVRVLSKSSPDELIIERKTVADFNQSVMSNHAHKQSEAYYDHMLQQSNGGAHVRVLWLIEGNPKTGVLPNQALNGLPQLEGWWNYAMMINDQHFNYTYGIRHSAYSIVKMAQGFFERTLQAPVSVGKTARIKRQRRESGAGQISSGASRPGMDLKSQLLFLDGMSSNVAEELSHLGKSFREILAMSEEELLEVKGVGTKRSGRIFNAFNMR